MQKKCTCIEKGTFKLLLYFSDIIELNRKENAMMQTSTGWCRTSIRLLYTYIHRTFHDSAGLLPRTLQHTKCKGSLCSNIMIE